MRLTEWAAWREWNPKPGPHTPPPSGSVQVVALDRAIALLPEELAATVREVYQVGTAMPDHVRRLGCPEATIARRIGRAHRLLIDILDTRLTTLAREDERATMIERLAGH